MRRFRAASVVLIAALMVLAATTPASASFHLMQVEQATGGVCGDRNAQAIQLRMRSVGQNLVAGTRLVVRDASGGSPVTLLNLPSNVSTSTSGARILLTTSAFARYGGPTADFTLTAPIPLSYLAAGKLTFEDAGGNVYWAIAWGGAGYTGSNLGTIDNDADGNFNPPYGSSLPALFDQVLRFGGAANAMSTNNAADYNLSGSPATFVNNAGTADPLVDCLFNDGFESGNTAAWSAAVP